MSGPKVPWRPGRIDGFAKDVTPDGRLPDASQGADHLRNVSKCPCVRKPLGIDHRGCRSLGAWGAYMSALVVLGLRLMQSLCSFNDQEIVALCGAHALGRCHPDR
jgi:cytochrome c peroxidase